MYTPEILSANPSSSDSARLLELKSISGITIYDAIEDQIKELIKCRNPKVKIKDNPEIYQQLHGDYLAGRDISTIGNWVYYPWDNNLVHLLDSAEFFEVRTNRNHYKITPEQQDALSSKKIGVIGLSVGKAVALTLAMERLFGEIRLADFDEIELSNLNRIQTPVTSLGMNKAVLVAREILEIDPYLDVKVYEDGITESNIDSFFTENGKLDALVEECDGLDIKIIARQKAKPLGIPVVMETNDRAMLDIERFDLEPDRPILHGLVEDLDVATLKTLKTNEDKVPYMLKMIGIEDTSVDLRASMLEIEQTITTWPQLASSVVFGGGLVCETIRRILIGEPVKSGRFYFDIDQQILGEISIPEQKLGSLKEGLSLEAAIKLAKDSGLTSSTRVDPDSMRKIAEAAHWAPSGGNMQPWRLIFYNNVLHVYLDSKLADSFLDYDYRGTMLGFGAMAMNIHVAALKFGYKSTCHFTFNENFPLVAYYTFDTSNEGIDDSVYKAMLERGSNRTLGNHEPVTAEQKESIQKWTESIEGASLQWLEPPFDDLAEVLGGIERIRLMTDRGHHDFIEEIRWTEEEAIETKDGIDLRTIELTETEKAGLSISKDFDIVRKLRDLKLGGGFEKMMRNALEQTGAVGFLQMPQNSRESYFEGGKASALAWVEATRLNLGFHPVSPSTFIFNRYIHESTEVQFEPFKEELAELRKKFKSILNLKSDSGEIFLFRLFNGSPITTKSLRRDLDLHYKYLN